MVFGVDGGFELGGVIGRGGMGEVRHAWDPWLLRDVALKTAASDVPASTAALIREARLTARLTHPNIIPVFAADRDQVGRPRYAMRLLDGRPLTAALAGCADGPARLAYVRNLIDVAGAVAYAHGNGVIHADLSPNNVIVGAYGETVVADWGLAVTREEAAGGAESGGGTVGTRSPEQARGLPLDARSDVYGLGALLYEVLTGTAPRDASRGPVPPVRSVAPTAPVELAAIADRALALDPEQRYPTARAFGDDLLAWFEGRRVSAHAYTVWELARRLAVAWRAPLATAALGLVLVLAVLVYGLARTAQQRDRALRAEVAAVDARAEAETSLSRALVAQALVAAGDHREMEAELLAASALALGESADARGVLSAFGGPVGLRSVARVPGPACNERVAAADGRHYLCAAGAEMSIRAVDAPSVVVAAWPGHPKSAVFSVDGASVRFLDHDGAFWEWAYPAPPRQVPGGMVQTTGRLGASRVPDLVAFVGGLGAGTHRTTGLPEPSQPLCSGHGAPRDALVDPASRLVVACEDGGIVRVTDGVPTLISPGDPTDGAPTAIAWDVPTSRILVGTATGRVVVLDPVTGARLARIDGLPNGIHAVYGAGDRFVALSAGRVEAVTVPDGRRLLSVRAPDAAAAWTDGGRTLRVISDVVETWALADAEPARRIEAGVGIAALDLSADGRLVAVGGGSGVADVYRRDRGERVASLAWQRGVIKDLAFSPDGRFLAVGAAGALGLRVFEAPGWAVVPPDFDQGVRRLAWLSDGTLLGATWRPRLIVRSPAGVYTEMEDWEGIDLEADPTGGQAVAVSSDHGVYTITPGTPPVVRPLVVADEGIAADVGPTGTLVALPDRVIRYDASGTPLVTFVIPAGAADVAVSPDGSLVAVGLVDGVLLVHRASDGAVVAHLHGHEGRVAALAFSADGLWLASGGWDGVVRFWSTPEWTLPAETLRDTLAATWGRRTAAVLSGE